MKRLIHWSIVSSPVFCCLALSAQTPLISLGLRNGGFEDGDGSSYAEVPFWESYFPEGAGGDPVLASNPKSGALRSFANGFQGAGNRYHPAQTIPGEDWLIAGGDVFEVRFSARAGSGFDIGSDEVQAILHVVDGSGNPVNDVASATGFGDRLLSARGALAVSGTYLDYSFTSVPVPSGSPWIGQRVQVRFLNTGDREEYHLLDDISLTGYRAGEFEPTPGALAHYRGEGDAKDETGMEDGFADAGLAFGRGFGTGSGFLTAGGGVSLPVALPAGHTIVVWLRTEEPVPGGASWREGQALLAGGGASGVGLSLSGERVVYGAGGVSLFSRTLVADGRWHHIAATRAVPGGRMELFVDGRLEDFVDSSPPPSLATEMALGRDEGGNRAFRGTIDEVRLFGGALDRADLEALRIGTGDSDGDGQIDRDEDLAGTDWGDAGDRLRPGKPAYGEGGFQTDVEGRRARSYELQRIELQGENGQGETVDSSTPLFDDGEITLADETAAGDRAFYQVKANKAVPARPNILLIVGDDHGYADLSAYSHARPDISTPNLDRIAAAGVRFTQAYVTSPVCSPSRCGFLTGRYQNEWERTGGWSPGLPADVKHLAEYLKEAGYRTAMIGKSDLGKNLFVPSGREFPPSHGFERFFGFSAHAHDFFLHSAAITSSTSPAWPGEASAHLGKYLNSQSRTRYEAVDDGVWQTTLFTDRAIGYLNEQAQSEEPFFLYLSHASVHALIHQVPKTFLDEVGVPELPLYNPATATADNPASYNDYYYRYSRPTPQVANGIITDADMRKYYRAHLKAYDQEIGRLLDALQSTGLADNTMVVYFSDNGGEALTGANNQPLIGSKYTLFEGGIRVPFLMSWPGVLPENRVYDGIVSTLDLAPTFVEAAGVEEAPRLRGHSLLGPVINDREVLKTERTLFWRFQNDYAVRRGDWKLVKTGKGIAANATSQIIWNNDVLDREALFNLAEDPGESTDRSDDPNPGIQAIKAELNALYQTWDASNG